ncbi:MAG: rod shape-determining protein [Prevotellaceae bacterium]|jgi:rod shape-determining protein MreB|nr:rod shape-determining protein [Prevotellaceae bacterium]
MKLFSLTQEVAIDLGTANTLIICNGKIVVDEPSIVAIDTRTDKLIAIGKEAQKMHERTHDRIRTIRPLKDGVIADFNAAELMISGMIKMIPNQKRWFRPSLKMVIGIPSGSTEVEIRAVRDNAEQAGGRDIFLIYEPMAAALGIGLDIEAPEGQMVVDIGGGTTEIAVISLGGLVADRSLKIAGDGFTQDIIEYMGRQYNMKIGEKTAEQIKMHIGSAMISLPKNEEPDGYMVHGPNRASALPMEMPITYAEIAHCLDKSISRIEGAIISALEATPPEIYADLVRNGIYLAGGGALLRGLATRFYNKIQIPFHVADDPLRAVARGTGIALKNTDRFQFLLR